MVISDYNHNICLISKKWSVIQKHVVLNRAQIYDTQIIYGQHLNVDRKLLVL